mmetsp:Transcript_29573/g.28784  ORF Transcript_29573/g.28784 Transcript_29573/m.28784 type:complete len:87 (+) Transcript_29573:2828-3088(+)
MGKQQLALTLKQRENSNNNDKKKTPKRLILKKSNERVKGKEENFEKGLDKVTQVKAKIKKVSKNSEADMNIYLKANDENVNGVLNN